MAFTISISQLLGQAFVIVPQRLTLPAADPANLGEFTAKVITHSGNMETTLAGTPWVDPLYLASAVAWDGSKFNGFQFPETTMVDATRKRVIVETAVAGRNGSVKELISCEDWMVRMRGLLINSESLDPPHAAIHELESLQRFQGAIPTEGALFRALGIDALVITDISLRQIPGTPQAVAFEISAVSDNSREQTTIEDL